MSMADNNRYTVGISEHDQPGKLRRLIRFTTASWRLNLAGAMEFRLSFLLTVGTMMVNNIVWIIFWDMYFQRFSVLNGWTMQDVMMMWAAAAGGFGIMSIFFGNATRLASLIVTGQLDVYLAQPKPVLLNVLISRMSVSAIGDLLFAIFIFLAFGNVTLLGTIKFTAALLLSALIFIFFCVITGCLSFWLGNTEGLSFQLYNALLTFATYPTGIFKGFGRLVLFTVIPAGFISSMPVSLIREIDLNFLFGAVGMASALCVGGILIFYKGLRRYTSGNMIGLRR
ncbi:ABC-2 family transporter protein [Paenibacillus lupini]|uniref:ABC transporter permease n=1 Tax=Paenibacillus lupini TaxID=1450204 RepID=UPI001FB92928|nr:ABC-2 family transporter protein [Paenibacillus lupini]NIK22412.1 ABC-2 type transport system permease protein [Paenibacillus lupini]